MKRNERQPVHGNDPGQNRDAPETIGLTIGAGTGPPEKYFQRTREGNVVLANDPADLTDPWWGMAVGCQPAPFVIVGRTLPMKQIFKLVVKLCEIPISILLYGRTGTGKELLAKALGVRSPVFTPITGDTVCSTLVESELFGHEKSAFTGATMARTGLLRKTHGGTLFLDEVQDTPREFQAKLLRVLDNGKVRPVGSEQEHEAKVRWIFGANQDLSALVAQGKFREDLYYRIGISSLTLPALQDRKDDILLLLVYFVYTFRATLPRKVTTISHQVVEKLQAYRWPGNIRELRKWVEWTMAVGEGPVLKAEEFNFDPPGDGTRVETTPSTTPVIPRDENDNPLPRLERIQVLLGQTPGMTASDLAQAATCTERTIQRDLQILRGKGDVVQQMGTDKRRPRYYLAASCSFVEETSEPAAAYPKLRAIGDRPTAMTASCRRHHVGLLLDEKCQANLSH